MKSKTSLSQKQQNTTITINTLRENAGEMLRVANHLEATQHFAGYGNGYGATTAIRGSGGTGKRRTIARGNRAHAPTKRGKDLAVVGKAA